MQISSEGKLGLALSLLGLLGAAVGLMGVGIPMLWPTAPAWVGWTFIGTGVFLFIIALFGGVALIAHQFGFEWRRYFTAQVALRSLFGIIFLIFTGLYFWHPSRDEEKQKSVSDGTEIGHYIADVKVAFVNSGFGESTLFITSYNTPSGLAVSPLYYLFYIQITNKNDSPVTQINDIVVSIQEPNGQWAPLRKIPLVGKDLYILTPGRQPNGLVPPAKLVPRGTFRLTPLPTSELAFARKMTLQKILEAEMPLSTQKRSIEGWAAFDFGNVPMDASNIAFRIQVIDNTNTPSIAYATLPDPSPNAGDPPVAVIGPFGGIVDLSAAKPIFYTGLP